VGHRLAVIGGRLENDNGAIYAELHRLSGGRIAILATASGDPDDVGSETVDVFRQHGFEATLIPIHGPEAARLAHDPDLVARMQGCGSLYFTGGDQALITAAFRPDGAESAGFKAIRRMLKAGGLISGSSAGAACLSGPMILGGTSVQALAADARSGPVAAEPTLGCGLGLFPHGVIDQHFIRRGRLGRLLVAMRDSGSRWGFGVDENSALILEGRHGRVVGEYGVMVFDLGKATLDHTGDDWRNIRVSYLDDGDCFDFESMKPKVGPAKKRIRPGATAWTAPAVSRRNVFGPYTFMELMVRLAEGDPTRYTVETAQAYDPVAASAVTLNLIRERRKSRALAARTGTGVRHSLLDFRLDILRRRVSRSEWLTARSGSPRGLAGQGKGISPAARLIVTGSSLLEASPELLRGMLDRIEGPVGVIGAANYDPHDAARDYCRVLRHHGIEAEDLGITLHNLPRLMHDAALLERVAAKRTLLFTGGDQRRLVDTMLYRGAETPLLSAMLHVYQSGGALVAVSGAAAALSGIMVAGGTSYQALRYGVAADDGHAGMVIEEGVGLFDLGIVDQNLIARNRLGRLIVACAEENARLGFGLVEQSGLVVHGGGSEVEVIGRNGVVLAELSPEGLTVQSDNFAAHGVLLSLLAPGMRFDALRDAPPQSGEEAAGRLEALIEALRQECLEGARTRGTPGDHARIQLAMRRTPGGRVQLDIDCDRLGADV